MHVEGVPSLRYKDLVPSRIDRLHCAGIEVTETFKTEMKELVYFLSGDEEALPKLQKDKSQRAARRVANFLHDRGHIMINPEAYK